MPHHRPSASHQASARHAPPTTPGSLNTERGEFADVSSAADFGEHTIAERGYLVARVGESLTAYGVHISVISHSSSMNGIRSESASYHQDRGAAQLLVRLGNNRIPPLLLRTVRSESVQSGFESQWGDRYRAPLGLCAGPSRPRAGRFTCANACATQRGPVHPTPRGTKRSTRRIVDAEFEMEAVP